MPPNARESKLHPIQCNPNPVGVYPKMPYKQDSQKQCSLLFSSHFSPHMFQDQGFSPKEPRSFHFPTLMEVLQAPHPPAPHQQEAHQQAQAPLACQCQRPH
eukprot:7899319-Lingulodinium_polyedra.AAC.1